MVRRESFSSFFFACLYRDSCQPCEMETSGRVFYFFIFAVSALAPLFPMTAHTLRRALSAQEVLDQGNTARFSCSLLKHVPYPYSRSSTRQITEMAGVRGSNMRRRTVSGLFNVPESVLQRAKHCRIAIYCTAIAARGSMEMFRARSVSCGWAFTTFSWRDPNTRNSLVECAMNRHADSSFNLSAASVIHVRRSVVQMVDGSTKTEASAKYVPLDGDLARPSSPCSPSGRKMGTSRKLGSSAARARVVSCAGNQPDLHMCAIAWRETGTQCFFI